MTISCIFNSFMRRNSYVIIVIHPTLLLTNVFIRNSAGTWQWYIHSSTGYGAGWRPLCRRSRWATWCVRSSAYPATCRSTCSPGWRHWTRTATVRRRCYSQRCGGPITAPMFTMPTSSVELAAEAAQSVAEVALEPEIMAVGRFAMLHSTTSTSATWPRPRTLLT